MFVYTIPPSSPLLGKARFSLLRARGYSALVRSLNLEDWTPIEVHPTHFTFQNAEGLHLNVSHDGASSWQDAEA